MEHEFSSLFSPSIHLTARNRTTRGENQTWQKIKGEGSSDAEHSEIIGGKEKVEKSGERQIKGEESSEADR